MCISVCVYFLLFDLFNFIYDFVKGVVTLQKKTPENEKYCSGITYQTLQITCHTVISTSSMIIFYVKASDLNLLNDGILRNGTSGSTSHSGLLRNTIEDKCTLADFNDISIQVMLDITTVHCPFFLIILSPVDIRNIIHLSFH